MKQLLLLFIILTCSVASAGDYLDMDELREKAKQHLDSVGYNENLNQIEVQQVTKKSVLFMLPMTETCGPDDLPGYIGVVVDRHSGKVKWGDHDTELNLHLPYSDTNQMDDLWVYQICAD